MAFNGSSDNGAYSVAASTDVALNNIANGQILSYDTSVNKWRNTANTGAGSVGPAGPVGMTWRGLYSNATTYGVNDAVSYNGSAFITSAGSTGVAPGTPSSPSAPWTLVSSIGATGIAGSGVPGVVGPSNVGILGWTYDPATQQGTTAYNSPYQGQIFGALLALNAGTISSISYRVWIAGNNLVANQNFIGIYSAAGSLIASTSDQTSNFQIAALHTVSFTASATISTGLYYVAFLGNIPVSGAVLPSFLTAYAGDTPTMNVGSTMRCGQLGNVGNLTTLPASFTPANNTPTNINFWAAIS